MGRGEEEEAAGGGALVPGEDEGAGGGVEGAELAAGLEPAGDLLEEEGAGLLVGRGAGVFEEGDEEEEPLGAGVLGFGAGWALTGSRSVGWELGEGASGVGSWFASGAGIAFGTSAGGAGSSRKTRNKIRARSAAPSRPSSTGVGRSRCFGTGESWE